MIIWWSSYEDKPPSLLLSVRSWDKCGSAQPWTLLPRALCKSISLQCRLKLEGFSSVSHNALWKFTHALLSADICSSGPSPPTLALNTGQNQFNALLYYAFSAEYCKAVCWKKDFKPVCSHTVFHILWSPPPLIAKKKTILCKPSHMWRSSMQKRWSGNQNAVQYLMQHCALQTPSRWNKNKKSGETKKRFLQKLETCSCSEESTPCVPNSDLSHKMSLWNKLFNLNVTSWRPSFDFWSLELYMAMNGGERKDNEMKKVSGASLVELSLWYAQRRSLHV